MNDSNSKEIIDAQAVTAINNRYAQYCWAADTRDKPLYADNYTEDAVLISGENRLVGRDAIANAMDSPLTNRHLTTTLSIDEFERDSARVHAYVLVLDEGGNIVGLVEAHDLLVREEDGAWRWKHRDVSFVYQRDSYKADVENVFYRRAREQAAELSP